MPSHLLHETLIRKQIQQNQALAIDILPRINSTIDYVKAKSATRDWPLVCLAEEQTQGRGQLNRRWHSPVATNISLSCSWLFQREIRKLEGLSLAVGISVTRALAAYGITENLCVKWPNDVYWQNKKLAGILIDTEARPSSQTFAIISVGLNVNMTAILPGEITQPWTSLSLILGADQDRNKMAGLLINQLLIDLALFNAQGFAPFLADWESFDYLREKQVTLKNAQGIFSGLAKGVDSRGHLLICTADGHMSSHVSGQLEK